MVDIVKQRMTVEVEEEFVVFLIGMRVNKWWMIHKWWPVSQAMPKMIKELYANPDMGFISQESWFGRTSIMVQYWKSFEHLEAYAKNRKVESSVVGFTDNNQHTQKYKNSYFLPISARRFQKNCSS